MNLQLRISLPFAKQPGRSVMLTHDRRPVQMKQPRLRDREFLVPAVALDDFRFRAAIDWIELELHLGRPIQVQHVQKVLRRFLDRDSHVAPLQLRPGSVFSSCRIRIQEPPSLAIVAALHVDVADTFGEAAESRVTDLGAVLTQYPKQLSDEARVRLLDALQRTIWTGRDIVTSPHSRPRCIIGREARDVFRLAPGPNMDDLSRCRTIPENHHIPFVDGTMYLGAKDDAVMIRLMDKVKDRQRPDGTCEQLDADRRRVRIEVSLKENERKREADAVQGV